MPALAGPRSGGLTLAPAVSEHGGRTHSLQVNLSPLGTPGVPGGGLAGRIISLEDLIGVGAAARLTEHLAEIDYWPDRFAALQAWVAQRVAAATVEPPDVS